jgi:small-conductance mechanosensitive channel
LRRGALGTVDGVEETSNDLRSVCGDTPSWLCEQLYDLTDGNRVIPNVVETILHVALIVFAAWIASLLARRFLSRTVARLVAPDRTAATRTLNRIGAGSIVAEPIGLTDEPDPRRAARLTSISTVVGSTATVIIWTIAGIVALGELGVDLAPLIAGAGIAGIALGFGAQSLVQDCIAGLFMLVEDQYGIGDVVDLDEATGTVERISLRTTVLRGVDGTVWHVPNGQVNRVGNKSQLWSVALVDVDVAYDCDLSAARRTIIECVAEVCARDEWRDKVQDDPQLLGVEALGADGITIRVTIRTEPGAQWALQRALREEIKIALDAAGIEIPFPQRTVWVRRDAGDTSADESDRFVDGP